MRPSTTSTPPCGGWPCPTSPPCPSPPPPRPRCSSAPTTSSPPPGPCWPSSRASLYPPGLCDRGPYTGPRSHKPGSGFVVEAELGGGHERREGDALGLAQGPGGAAAV